MTTTNHPETSFFRFIWNERRNRNYLLIALGGMVVQFIVFKMLYPFPDFFSDSYSFIWAAKEHMNVNLWPIGYSKYLLLIHYITHSDTFLIATQYLLVILSGLYFYFTILYWYNPSRSTRIILFLFLFFNPLFLYLSNYVASEALFLGLSVIWFTQLLWIINKPKNWMILTHAIVLLLAFTVRYNAMYYPIISTVAFIMSRQRVITTLAGIGLSVLLVSGFVVYTREEMYKVTGTKEFSVLGGWHLANSALYMYQFIQVDSNKFQDPECKILNRMVHQYFGSFGEKFRQIGPSDGAFYLKDSKGPLKEYMYRYKFQKDALSDFIAWAKVAPIFSNFSATLIKENKIAYLQHYLFPNAINYFIPPLEKLEIYNLGDTRVGYFAKDWFNFQHSSVDCTSATIQGTLLFLYPILFFVINIGLISSLLFIIYCHFKKDKKIITNLLHLTIVIVCLWATNALFSIFAAPIVFRYQVFPMIVMLSFFALLVEKLDTVSKHSHSISFMKRELKSFTNNKI